MQQEIVKALKGSLDGLRKEDISKIRIGFEPASDDDSCLLVIDQEAIDLESAIEQILR